MRKYHRWLWLFIFLFTSLINIAQQNAASLFVPRFNQTNIELKTNNSPCAVNFFYKTYFNTSVQTLGLDAITTSDGQIVMCGETRGPYDGFIVKTDANGIVQWQLGIGGPGTQLVLRVIESNDHHILAFGFDNSNGIPTQFLIKLDFAGNIIWRQDYQFSVNFGLGESRLRQDPNGDIYVVAYWLENNLSFQDRIILLRFDQAGNLLMNKMYKPSTLSSTLFGADFLIQGNSLYITGKNYPQSIVQGILMKVDKFNGNIVFTKTYDFNGNAANFFQIFPYQNDLYILGSDNLNETDTAVFIRTDTLGNVVATNYMKYGSNTGPGTAMPDNQGGFIWSSYYRPGGPINLAITRVHPLTGVVWAHQYPQIPNIPRTEGMGWLQDSSFIISGYGSSRTFLGKFSKDGDNGCAAQIVATSHGTGSSTATNRNFLVSSLVFTPVNKTTINSAPLLPETDSSCVMQVFCDSLKLSAPLPVCSKNDTVTVNIIKNAGCILTPSISYDTSKLSLVSISNGLIRLKALQNGTSKLKVSLSTSCATLQDSVFITALFAPDTLNLGDDSTLCPGSTFMLNAHQGYSSYTWQDGSNDSIFTVTQPGLYHVTVSNNCGLIFTDTIYIVAAPPILFNAGPDRIKCNNDTLHFAAPPGFLNYTWSNNYNISSTTTQNVVANPFVDTAYYIKAEKTPGCFAFDTIRVKVNTSPPIDLGIDKSFCFGDSVVIGVGSGFQNYQWNTGENASQIIVKAVGDYSVMATTIEGCKSFDTMKVIAVFPLPSVNLDKNTGLCAGTQRILDAGNYAFYQWNTGATSQSIQVNTVGSYTIVVTNANGCKGGDSVTITTIHPLPSTFLPPDTVICSYGTLLLKPIISYNQYLWNNGSNNSSLTITQPGNYWLEVVDHNTCRGRDSIVITAKQCLKGLFVPTAFTPNGDGRNDVFRPMLFGDVKKYRFTVYNRWGQVVFQTTEQLRAWDGSLKGVIQQTGVFVWTCAYQFEGEDQKAEKGTVTLIR